MRIGILVVDDHQLMREGLRALIEKEEDMEVVAEAEDGRKAVQLATDVRPDVVILDVAMPDLNGVEAARQITTKSPGVKVLALSMYSDKRFVVGMLKAGASGYLLKDCASQELISAIRCVTEGEVYLSPKVAGVIVGHFVRDRASDETSPFSALTPREREVLQLLAEGKNTREIAESLGVSVKTVETHRMQTMRKLDLHSVAELTKYAIREGLTSLDR